MKVFVTGASGFVGSAVVKELIGAGHDVIGLARNAESAKKINGAGAVALPGGLEDLDILKKAASEADGVIHTAFVHDFSQYLKAGEIDKAAINAMGEALLGTEKPIVVTSGMLGLPPVNGIITEESNSENSPRTSESSAKELAAKGINASSVRFPPSVHDKGDKGFIPFLIQTARNSGISAYANNGENRWSAVHRADAAKAFRLAVEKAQKGAIYNVVADKGIEFKSIATLIGAKLNLPVVSLSGDEISRHFDWMGRFATLDAYATGAKTEEVLNWKPTNIGLLKDMEENYF